MVSSEGLRMQDRGKPQACSFHMHEKLLQGCIRGFEGTVEFKIFKLYILSDMHYVLISNVSVIKGKLKWRDSLYLSRN